MSFTPEKSLMIHAAEMDFHAQQIDDAHSTDVHSIKEKCRAIFLHGIGDDLRTWDSVWAALENNLSALRYDLRGFGKSIDNSGAPFNHADDLLAILDAIDIERCDLIGVSMGGSIALNFALDHPERVRNLVLISPGIVAWEWSDTWKKLWQPIAAKASMGAMDEARDLW